MELKSNLKLFADEPAREVIFSRKTQVQIHPTI